MADISQFKDRKTNTLYNIKDAQARADLLTKQDAIETVSVDYQEDGGSPSASAEFNNGELEFTMKNMKMKFSELTATEKAELKGEKGDQGDSVIVGEGDLPLANTLGTSSEKAITQKAATDAVNNISAKVQRILGETTIDESPDVNGYLILASGSYAGRLFALESAAYRKIDVEGYEYVRYLGVVQASNSTGESGAAFYDSTANPTTSSNTGFLRGIPFEVGSSSTRSLKEYVVAIPEGAKYLYVMSKFVNADVPTFNDDFYCYLESESPFASKEELNAAINEINTISSKVQKITTEPTIDESPDVNGYLILASGSSAGYLYAVSSASYRKIDVEGYKYVRFLGVVQRMDSTGESGAAFYDNTANPTTSSNTGFLQGIPFEIGSSQTRSLKEYVVAVPENAKYLYVMSKFNNEDVPTFSDDFYCCLESDFASKEDINRVETKILSINKKPLFIGTLVNRAVESTKLSDNINNTRVSMQSETRLPYQNIKLYVKIKNGYYFTIRYGSSRDTLSVSRSWFDDDSIINIPSGYIYYRCSFSKGSNHTDAVTADEINDLIANGEIEISYESNYDVVQSNMESEKYIKSILRYFFSVEEAGTSAAALKSNGHIPNIPTFGHTSDIHGDVTRYQHFLDYCDYIGVDAALISGDFAANKPTHSCQYINDVADEHEVMVLPCTGNHDCYGLTTAQQQREQVVGYLMDKNDVVTNSLEDYPTYFYKDIPDKKIRIISLNTYEGSRSGHNCNFTQKQCEWLIAALSSTPSGYGVIIMFHSPESQPQAEEGYESFYQNKYAYGLYYQVGITGEPISKVVDAFISKSSAAISYTSNSVAITVNPDFSQVNSGVEFIAYVTGHQHMDWIGPVAGTVNRQLMLNVTSTCTFGLDNDPYGSNLSDLPRDEVGSTQDAFNIYGIDRINKTVRIVRIGSNLNFDGKERRFMIIPYSNN